MIGALCTVVVLTGCSQTAALAPVGGDRLAEVRFAALDVLTTLKVEILVAPVCTASGPGDAAITCVGTTTDQKTIAVSSTANDQDRFEVLVNGESIFTGVVIDVLNSAARPPS